MIKSRLPLILSSFFLLILLASRPFCSTPGILENISSYLTYPLISLAQLIARPIRKSIISEQKALSLSELSEERNRLLAENAKLKAMLNYQNKSRHLQEFEERYELKNATLAKILLRTFSNSENTVLVNRGSRNGIKKDMVAIYKFQLIGRVTEVFSCHSKIRLITDKRSKVAVYMNTGNAVGVVVGHNQLDSCTVKYVSHLETIHPKDLVFSSGEGLVFPEGFCMGTITNIKSDGVCQEIELKPLVDLKKLEMCLITNQEKMNLF